MTDMPVEISSSLAVASKTMHPSPVTFISVRRMMVPVPISDD